MDAMNSDAWDESPVKNHSTEDVDEMVMTLLRLKEDYKLKKHASNAADALYKDHQTALVQTMKDLKKKNWNIAGIGTVTVVNTKSVTAPKDFTSRRYMLEYFLDMPTEVWVEKLGVNSRTLNTFYNAEADIAESEGRLYTMPGVEEPTIKSHTSFREEKK